MIEITFQDFYERKFKDEGFSLYVLKNGLGDVLYVGISSDPIWLRWFGDSRSHSPTFPSDSPGTSAAARKVIDHLPESGRWKIQLWTLAECVSFTNCLNYLESAERAMIDNLSPILNGWNNARPGKDTTPKNYKEKKHVKSLERTHKDIFG